ncbi:MAG: NUDIX hydrolase [Rhizobiaceae bacterium]
MKTREEAGERVLGNSEIERIETMINSPQMRKMRQRLRSDARAITPRNAATIVVIDGKPGQERILMGKRNRNLKFMPGALVFPGGSVDRADGSVLSADELNAPTEEKLVRNLRGRPSKRMARALGMAAVRELGEETGILVGRDSHERIAHPDWADFSHSGLVPAISGLKLLSRAITPPGPPRRFDTWFFMLRADEIAHTPEGGFKPSGELEELQWIRPQDAINTDTREITRVMLVELMNRLKHDPWLDPEHSAPFYFSLHGKFHKKIL